MQITLNTNNYAPAGSSRFGLLSAPPLRAETRNSLDPELDREQPITTDGSAASMPTPEQLTKLRYRALAIAVARLLAGDSLNGINRHLPRLDPSNPALPVTLKPIPWTA